MYDLEKYREHLINFYVRANENNATEKQKRADYVKKNHKDRKLAKIIKHTDRFITMLVEKMRRERYVSEGNIFDTLELANVKTPTLYVLNGCGGGWPADTLFAWQKKPMVSKFIVEQHFGETFTIEILTDVTTKFSVNGPIDIFDKL